jgi:hypothetical protein
MNRRGFLGSLAAFAAACTLDPELALWRPGAKTISVPKPLSMVQMERFYFAPAIALMHQSMLESYRGWVQLYPDYSAKILA